MKHQSIVTVSLERGQPVFDGIDNDSHEPVALVLADTIVTRTKESLPIMGRRSAMAALLNLIPSHVPGRVEDYCMDARLESRSEKRSDGRRSYEAFLIRRIDLQAIRERYPWTPILPDVNSRRTEIFRPKKIRPVDRLLIFGSILVVTSLILCGWTGYLERRQVHMQQSETNEMSRNQIDTINEIKDDIATLRNDLVRLKASSPRTITGLLATLTDVANDDLELVRVSIDGRSFILQGTSEESLELVRRLEQSDLMQAVTVSEIRPGSDRDKIVLKGEYRGP